MTRPPTPRFRGGRPFRILQVTDTHYDLGDPGHAEVEALLGAALDALAPDLVAHTGDAVEPPRLAEGWAALTAPIARRGVPWCAVLGNHDLDPARGVSHRDVMGMVGALPGSLAQVGPEALRGGGTYALPILAPDGGAPRFWLWCLDSQDSSMRRALPARAKVGGYGWPTPGHVEWLRGRLARAEAPGLCLCHIPPPEVRDLWPRAGASLEAPPVNVGLLHAAVAGRRVLAVAFGHAHAHDGAGERFGVGLAYGRYSGGPNRRLLPESGVRVWDVAPDGRSAETFVWTAAHGRGAAQTFALRETVPC